MMGLRKVMRSGSIAAAQGVKSSKAPAPRPEVLEAKKHTQVWGMELEGGIRWDETMQLFIFPQYVDVIHRLFIPLVL